MANTIVQYSHFSSGQALELHLHPLSGQAAKANAVVVMSQPGVGVDPLLYELVVPEALTGWYRAYIFGAGGSGPTVHWRGATG